MYSLHDTVEMTLANECAAAFVNNADALLDRKLFVHNLGIVLHQTREGVISAELNDHEQVLVTFNNGGPMLVNVNCDSYMAIIRDVAKSLQ